MQADTTLLRRLRKVEALGIPYAVMGGFAARAWGLPRATYDADIAVAVDGERLQLLFDALEKAGFDVPTEHRGGFLYTIGDLRKAKIPRIADGQVCDIDLFIVHGELLAAAVNRARAATIGTRQVRVITPEDVILLKLLASRRKDLLDVEDIVALWPNLDDGYLRDLAARLNIRDRLAEFFP